jgi:hypothetical protein
MVLDCTNYTDALTKLYEAQLVDKEEDGQINLPVEDDLRFNPLFNACSQIDYR